ncbi:MAG: tyrosine-type recombinase/integrase [Synergistaceae bacterium]|jgi:integrase|nr:tyrosine-type recombinase/integrase [Synergistaceae bacterium]
MKKTVPIYDKIDVYRLLKYLREWNSNYYIAAVIGIQWGLRCSDILALQVGDVVAGEGSRIQIIDRVRLREIKTGHERHILVTEEMKDVLYEHIKGSGTPVDMGAPLVLSRNKNKGKAKPLSRYRLWRVVSNAAHRLGIKGPIGTHSLRKTFAYQAWRDGERVDVIQKEFGHASVDTTHRYACIPDERQDGLYKKVSFAFPSKRGRGKNRSGKPGPESRFEGNAKNP